MYILFVICLYCVDIFSASFFFKLPTSSSILPRWTIAVLMHRRGEEGRETVPKNGLKMVARCCMSRVHFFFALYLVVFHSFSMFSLAWCRQPKVLAVLTTVLVKVFASDKLCLAFARPWLDRTRIRWTRTRQKKCLHPSASSASASLRWVDGRVAALCGAEAEIEILKILTLRNIMDYSTTCIVGFESERLRICQNGTWSAESIGPISSASHCSFEAQRSWSDALKKSLRTLIMRLFTLFRLFRLCFLTSPRAEQNAPKNAPDSQPWMDLNGSEWI